MKKKILFLNHTLGAGGAEKVLVNLANNMSKKYDVTVMTVIDTGVFKKSLDPNVTYKTIFKIPFKKKNGNNNESGSLLNGSSKLKKIAAKCYSFLWKFMPTKILYRLFIKDKYDVEVAFLEGICAKVISSSNQSSKKFAWIHVDLINENKSDAIFFNTKSAKKCYSKFDKIVCVSNEVRKQFIKKYNFDEDSVVVKHNVIDTDEIRKKAKEKLDVAKPKEFTLVTIGRLSKQKGYDRLVSIANKLKKDKISFHLWIIGVGPKEQELKQYVEENKLTKEVEFLGFKSNPFPYLKNADLFVCSSRAEGFSTVACEATVLGLPIVTTDCSGMEELLGKSEYGLITDNSEKALYKGIKGLLTDESKYKFYKKQINKIKDSFDISNTVKEIEEMFGEK